ncbi:MAG: DUF6550 family protein [Oscillospiraceae bacterium]
MKEKTKRGLIIGGATAVCAAMVCVIGMQFTKDDEPIQTAKLPEQTTPAVTVAISTTARTESEPIVEDENTPPELNEETPEETVEIPEDAEVIQQDFPEQTTTAATTPPPPPEITDEAILTNPDVTPEYTPEQTTVADTSDEQPADAPKHGEKKDGKIYINGFGWVIDNGGGGQAEYADDMFENGNKIGYFG